MKKYLLSLIIYLLALPVYAAGLTISTISCPTDPSADVLFFYDDSADEATCLTLGTNLSITGTTINASGGGGSVAGSDTQVQFNDAAAFGADAGLTYNKTTDTLTIATGIVIGSSNPFSDSAGTLTLQNVDAVDATTESTIEAAIDTLANLVSVQGKTLTLGGNFITSGASSITLTSTGATNVTLPTTGTLATLAGSETLTNKTLTTPIISTISNTGTITFPTATDTLVARATTDTLTNKTINGDNNTVTNVAGYTIELNGAQTNWADATTYYFGSTPQSSGTTADVNRVYMPRACTITSAYASFQQSSAGVGTETSTITIRKNNSTDTNISTGLLNNAAFTKVSNTGLSIGIAAGDYIEAKLTTPTWATNPTQGKPWITLFCKF